MVDEDGQTDSQPTIHPGHDDAVVVLIALFSLLPNLLPSPSTKSMLDLLPNSCCSLKPKRPLSLALSATLPHFVLSNLNVIKLNAICQSVCPHCPTFANKTISSPALISSS